MTKLIEHEIKDTGSWCMIKVFHAKDSYCAKFHTHSYHMSNETHMNSYFDKVNGVKFRSSVPGHGACLICRVQCVSLTITMQYYKRV